MPSSAAPCFADITAAADRIQDGRLRTPLLESPSVNRTLGGRLLVKAENLQITGSFKLRGALNRLAVMTPDERARGVVARSSGNHGLAIAYCAGRLGIDATVVVPASAPKAKTDRIRAFGAAVRAVENIHELAAVAAEITHREGRILVPPADDPWIIAGAGTVGLEIAEQAQAQGAALDALLVCCSGGGLTAGCLLALQTLSPATIIASVEPRGFDKMARSLRAGRPQSGRGEGTTFCDALSGPFLAPIAFGIVNGRLAEGLAVTDEEVQTAMRTAFVEFGLALEPGGAAALAAALSGRFPITGKTVAVTATGRNMDLDLAALSLAGR